jgi:hypothetical protein
MNGSYPWTLYGFQTKAEGRVVQEWFDGLSDEEKNEARDTIGYLQHLDLSQWKLPRFEHIGDGLSEIRFKVASLNLWVRIYGSFWPPRVRRAYTLLYGGNKKVKNDRRGKKEAGRRKRLLENNEATVHEFEF